MFDEEAAQPARPDAAAVRRRQRRRFAAELGAAAGHARDRRRERVGARRHGVRQPRVRLRHPAHPAARGSGELPVPVGEHRRRERRATTRTSCKPSKVFRVDGERVGVIGATVQNTPELVAAGNTDGLSFLDEAAADQAGVGAAVRRAACAIQIVVIHNGADPGANAIDGSRRPCRGTGPINPIVDAAPGHDDRPRDRRAHPQHRQLRPRPHPDRRGRERGRQLHGRPADAPATATCAGPAPQTRIVEGPRRRAASRTCRRSSTRPTRDTAPLAQAGDRDAQRRHQARPEPPHRVGDGQHGRRRDAR